MRRRSEVAAAVGMGALLLVLFAWLLHVTSRLELDLSRAVERPRR